MTTGHDRSVLAKALARAKEFARLRDAGSDDFTKALMEEGVDVNDLGEIAGALEAVAPPADLKGRLFASTSGGRLARFTEQVALLLDLDEASAGDLLERIDDASSWSPSPLPMVELFHLEGGSVVDNAITGFVRIDRDGGFPHHEHIGHEYALVVQGGMHDVTANRTYRPGDVVHMAPGTGHELTVAPGPRLIYLTVAFEGVSIAGMVIGPNDAAM